DARRARTFPGTAPRPGMGRSCFRGRAHRRRAHPAAQEGPRALRARPPDRDRAGIRVSLLRQPGVSVVVIVLAAIAVVLVIRVAYHQLHLTALRTWLRRPQLETLPRGRGVWEEALAELHRFLRRRDAEQESLAQSLARFRAAVRALQDGVVILDREHRIEWANPTAAHHFGIDARRDLGQPVVNLIRQPDFVTYLAAGDFIEPLALRTRDTTLSVRVIEFGEEQKLLNSRDVT